MAAMENPGALAGATGAEMPCHANAAGTCNLAQSGDECHCADELAHTADTLQDATAAVRLLEIMADLRCQAVRHD